MKPRLEKLLFPLRTPARAWTAVAVYAVLLVATVEVVLAAYLWVFGILGQAWVSRGLYGIFAIAGCTLVWVARPLSKGNWIALGLIGLAAAVSLTRLSVPADRIHLLQYGPLTLLLFQASRLHFSGLPRYLVALVGIGLVGLIDESVQGMRPERYFAWSDIGFDLQSAALVLLLLRFVFESKGAPEVKEADQS